MQYYQVTGKHFLTEEKLAEILSCSKPTYIRKEDEKGIGRPITPDDKIEDPWLDLNMIFQNEIAAIMYAKKNLDAGKDGSFATIEKCEQNNSAPMLERTTVCEMKKENGETTVRMVIGD